MNNRFTPIRAAESVPGSTVLGFGDYRPKRVQFNAEIVDLIDSSDEWIQERSGIKSRRVADEQEDVVYMATQAAAAALEHAGLEPSQVDQVIVASVTYPSLTPAAAPLVAKALGCGHGPAYDVAAACAGYPYGIAVADATIRAGAAKYSIVIGVEKFSDFRNPYDRGTAFIFGDGAGAAVLGPSDEPGVGPTIWGADGDGADLIAQIPDWLEYRKAIENPNSTPEDLRWPYIGMKGPSVFRWAAFQTGPIALAAVEAAGLTIDDIDVFIPHQANTRIIDTMVKKLALPDHVVVAREDIADMANTSAASIPLATARLYREGRVESGQLALQLGFGAGLAWAAQVIRLP